MALIWTITFVINKVLTALLGVFLRVVARYRREVVRENLGRVYPNCNRVQLLALERGFYNYLGGLLWDLLRSSVGAKDLGQKKIQWENPEVLMDLAAQNKSLVLLTSHYGNWEWIAQAMGARFKHRIWFVYKPLQWTAAEDWLRKWRTNRHVVPVALKALRSKLASENLSSSFPLALYLGADQSPTAHSRWIPSFFLGQPTAVYQGPEELCRTYGLTPVRIGIRPLPSRGSYAIRFERPGPNWSEAEHGSLMHWYMNALSQQIHEAPEYWLWTHRRWKLNRELGLDGPTQEQIIHA